MRVNSGRAFPSGLEVTGGAGVVFLANVSGRQNSSVIQRIPP